MIIVLAFFGIILFDLWMIKEGVSERASARDKAVDTAVDPAEEYQRALIRERARLAARAERQVPALATNVPAAPCQETPPEPEAPGCGAQEI